MRAFEPFAADVQAWVDHGWPLPSGWGRTVGVLALLVRFPGLRATLIYRLAHLAHRRSIPFVPTLLTQLNVTLHAIELPPGVEVGPGLYMPHAVGNVVTARRIGTGVTLQGGITLGMRRGDDFPTIGDGVVIGAGARVLGDIHVGSRAQVGAGSVVLEDVPMDATVVGVPARIVSPSSDAPKLASKNGNPDS